MGPQGPAGFPGLSSHRGEKGAVGAVGHPGQKGIRGLPGEKGVSGPQGPKGLRGSEGRQGLPGVKGERGSGLRGTKGSQGEPGQPAAVVGGVTYNRWGHTACRSGVSLVYSGKTGSSYSGHSGGGSNYLCMPNDPQYMSHRSGVQGYSYVYGTEYEATLVSGRSQHNAACAVCYIPNKHTTIMIPAKTTCSSGWIREYYGYLMSESVRNSSRMKYACVDIAMRSIPGSQNHIAGGHFYHVEAHCNGVSCPPYDNAKELTCVVCSK